MDRDGDDARPRATKSTEVPETGAARFARRMRQEPTDAERVPWLRLRGLSVKGSHFRRQVTIGSSIADFACRRARLVVEVDGGRHAENARHAERTTRPVAQGWTVLRFWNDDVLSNIDGVREAIACAVEDGGALSAATPTPDPSPQGGGEKSASPA